mgnify:CR=1 FL=1
MSRWRLPLLTLSALLLLTAALWAALPEGMDSSKPQDTDPISQGAKQIRDFKLFVADVFGIPATPSLVNAAAFKIATPGIVNFPQGIGSTTTQVGITGYLRGNGSGTVTGIALPVFGRVVRTAGDLTTTSTTLVDLTGASVTLTTEAFPVHIAFTGTGSHDTAGRGPRMNVDVDGTLLLGTTGQVRETGDINQKENQSFALDSAALTAAPHTVKVQWSVESGTGTIVAGSGTNYVFSVHEIK